MNVQLKSSSVHMQRVIPQTPGSVGKRIGAVKYLQDGHRDSLLSNVAVGVFMEDSGVVTRSKSLALSPGVKRRSCVLHMLM